MTYTILARCSRSGRIGVGIATYSLAVGGLCPAVRSGAGAVTSQAFVNPELRQLGTSLLAAGHSARQTLRLLTEDADFTSFRQVGVLDREGRTAVHTGSDTRPWSGHAAGPGFLVLGNVLADEAVVAAMARAFEAAADQPLSSRLLLALEAGRSAGGQKGRGGPLPERSAAVRVHGPGAAAEIDLRVDMHPTAIEELRRIHDAYLPYVAYHRQRWLNPANSLPQEEFVAALEADATP